MMMKILSFCFLVAVLAFGPRGLSAEDHKSHEQTVFNAQDLRVERPVDIPQPILSVLANDEYVSSMKEDAPGNASFPPRDWFAASLLVTRKSGSRLYLILGKGPLVGAHVTTFWLVEFGVDAKPPTVLLRVAADQLIVGKHDASSYPKVTAVVVTQQAVTDTTYRFSSGKYLSVRPTNR